jgi:hypothetical protein
MVLIPKNAKLGMGVSFSIFVKKNHLGDESLANLGIKSICFLPISIECSPEHSFLVFLKF